MTYLFNNTRAGLLAITLFFSAQLFCQATAPAHEDKPYIEVTGRAEKEVVPDEIYISIVLREKYVNKEKVTIEVQEEKLKTALKGIGINLSNLYLSDANADYVRVRWRTRDVLTKKDYTLKVATANEVTEVFKQLDMLDINDAYVARVNHSKLDSLKKEMRIQAIKAAKTKAEYLLAAIGEQVGKPLAISESTGNMYDAMSRIPGVNVTSNIINREYRLSDKSKEEEDVQFKMIKVEASIYVKFGIK
jgi:uncharacterized protein YggE